MWFGLSSRIRKSGIVDSETYGKVQSMLDGYVTSIVKRIIIMELQVPHLLSIVDPLLLMGIMET
jgi:hypothetical protein